MIKFIAPEWPAPPNIGAFSTTRLGGDSLTPFDGFNLAAHVEDDPLQVSANRNRLRVETGLPDEPCWLDQTHGIQTVQLDIDRNRDADAAVTRLPGKVAVVMTADCLPILLCNRDGSEVAAVHAGWRGLQAGVIQSALDAMISNNQDLIAWIGPAITQPHFEVGDEVLEQFQQVLTGVENFFQQNRPGHWLCDLAGLARQVLEQHEVAAVFSDPHCSYRDEELFYSYRRASPTGRMATLIWIKQTPGGT